MNLNHSAVAFFCGAIESFRPFSSILIKCWSARSPMTISHINHFTTWRTFSSSPLWSFFHSGPLWRSDSPNSASGAGVRLDVVNVSDPHVELLWILRTEIRQCLSPKSAAAPAKTANCPNTALDKCPIPWWLQTLQVNVVQALPWALPAAFYRTHWA